MDAAPQSLPRVTILDDYQDVALHSADWSPLRGRFVVDAVTAHVGDDDELVARIGESTVVVAMRERTPFPDGLLARLPQLRLLVTTGMRNASIDMDAAHRRGIVVSGTDAPSADVSELTMGMMIALMRNFTREDAGIRAGGWQHTIGPALAGRTLGIVGLGRLGTQVARLARAFGMTVTAWSPHLTQARADPHHVTAVDKHTLFATSDVVTIHMPLVAGTRGIVGAHELAAMAPTAYLINTSRGPLVDEAALIAALQERCIAGAALDVYDTEPLPAEHPLRSLDNTLLLPHIGYVSTDTYRAWFGQVVGDIVAWADGAAVRVIAGATG